MQNASPPRRILFLWLRRLSTDRLTRHSAPASPEPLVIAGPVKNALRLTALNDAAEKLGLARGMPLADARAMHPGLAVAEENTKADQALLESLGDWCERYTPLIGLSLPDGLALDITGCAHLFGGEEGLLRDLALRLRRFGLKARASIADTPGCAFAMAHFGKEKLISPGDTRKALLPLPLACLRLDADSVQSLAQSGLFTIADIINRPRAPLAARFGMNLLQRLDQALGLEKEAITPRQPLPAFSVEQAFAEPLVRTEDALQIVTDLATRLSRIMERHRVGARALEALLFRVDGVVQRLAVGTSRPLRDPVFIRRLFADRFFVTETDYEAGFGYDLVRLSARETETTHSAQDNLDASITGPSIAHLTDRLTARLGESRVLRLIEQDTHNPEAACIPVPAHEAREFEPPAPRRMQDTQLAARPLRLLAPPEAISDAMAEVPDGPPKRFRWRRVLHTIVASEGPERIAMEWWRDDKGQALTRDYYRVASQSGARFWLYREGLFGEEPQPRWFVHGLFA
jgi:protein ImuB